MRTPSEISDLLELRRKFEEYDYLKDRLERKGYLFRILSDRTLEVWKDGKLINIYNDQACENFLLLEEVVKSCAQAFRNL